MVSYLGVGPPPIHGGIQIMKIWIVVASLTGLFTSNVPAVASTMQQIREKVAHDAEAEYDIAKRQGDPMQICVQAGMVAAAQLQAQDEAHYRQWKSIEAEDCCRAGLQSHCTQQVPNEVGPTSHEGLYELAKRKRNVKQMCIQAWLVSEARFQGKLEEDYKYWKKIEIENCRLAHIPWEPIQKMPP
jgi:hypothetical protein